MFKLYLFAENFCTGIIKTISKANTTDKLLNNVDDKYLTDANKYSFILIQIKPTNFNENTNIPINYLGGPYKLLFTIFDITQNGELDVLKDDPRNIQYLYITPKYLQKETTIKIKHLKILASKALQDKLEKRPLAKKLIEDYL